MGVGQGSLCCSGVANASGFCTSGPPGTTGTTGACLADGTTAADCGEAHAACTAGQTCQAFGGAGTGAAAYRACACDAAGAGGSGLDSCEASATGETVCDVETRACRAPRDYDAPNGVGTGCDLGFGPWLFAVDRVFCVEGCETSADCGAPFTTCAVGAVTVQTAGGARTYVNHCEYNLCGPDGHAGQTHVPYYGACDAHGAGDGVCQPVQGVGSHYAGLCYATGTAAPGAACSGFRTGSEACAGTALCVPTGLVASACASVRPAVCLPTCNAAAPAGACAAETACVPYAGNPPQSPLQAGVCE